MKNSVRDCWALTFYGIFQSDGAGYSNYNSFQRTQEELFAKGDAMYKEALSICRDDETMAQLYLILGNTDKVRKLYPATAAAEYVRKHCDTASDYRSANQPSTSSTSGPR